MKRLFCIVIVMCIIGMPPLSGTWAKDDIRLTNGEWKPYLSQTLKHYGFASHVVTKAFELQGVQVKYGFFPWKRSFVLARDGYWDGTVVWGHGEGREKHFYYSKQPVMHNKRVLFHLKDTPFGWERMEDLKGIRFGTTRGYYYGPIYEKAVKENIITPEVGDNDVQNFKKLLGGRIDVFVCNIEVGLYILRNDFSKNNMEKITYHPRPIDESGNYLLLSRKIEENEQMIKLFDKGFKDLRMIGGYEKMLRDLRSGKYE